MYLFIRQYGIEPSIVNNIIKILLEHLSQGEDDLLNAATLRTVAQFMIERKDIVISLLNFTLKCQPVIRNLFLLLIELFCHFKGSYTSI